jgi:hypothetical protein
MLLYIIIFISLLKNCSKCKLNFVVIVYGFGEIYFMSCLPLVLLPGNLKNTEALNFGVRHNFILQVVATDCGKKRSKPVFVNIKVQEICRSGWEGEFWPIIKIECFQSPRFAF